MDWDKLKIFHNVALDLNISEAANKMNISHSSISRQISSLERDLKVSPVSYTHLTLPTMMSV